MKSILDIFHKWCNWNNRQVGNTYRFVNPDNFLFVWGGTTWFRGTVIIKAVIGGVEQEITYDTIGNPIARTDITPGTICTVSWDDDVPFLMVNDTLVFGEIPTTEFYIHYIQQKTDTLTIEKSYRNSSSTELHYTFTSIDGYDVTQSMIGIDTNVTVSARIGSLVGISWSNTVTYLKANDKIFVG